MSENKEQKFYKALQDVFIGAKIEGQGGFVNLMKIKSNYYSKIEKLLKNDIEKALKQYPDFRNELFDKLYSFFSRYFSESGSIYFNSTPFHNNVYEKVYSDEKDVILFWKTWMLYYVKTDRIFKSLEIESDGFKFFFDVSNLEHKKANEKRSLVYKLNSIKEDQTIVLEVQYSEKGSKTKIEDIQKALKKNNLNISEEQLEHAFRIFEKQSEVDFFINKNAKAFLQEQFKLWSYQYFWDGATQWTADRVNQLQILKDIAYKIIDFIAQFEDELVKIWNKPKFVKNANYVITLDRIWESSKTKLESERSEFPSDRGVSRRDGVLTNAPETKSTKWYELPYNPALKERARELRKAGNLSEVLFWQQVNSKQFLGLDFDRQKIIGNYIVDFFIKDIGVIVEIDGDSHNNKEEYNKQRDEHLKSLGLYVIHVRDEDVKNDINGVMRYIKECIERTPLAPLQEGETTPLTPLQEGNLVKKILKHPGIDQQINEWRELGMVDDSFNIDEIIENDLLDEHLNKKYEHLPIDTKYFKDLELEILNQFDDFDKSLDGWLIKSENYQALNTILPKFKEKIQTIYIDPPFNLDSSDQFLYRTNYKDANWATLLENRLRIAKDWLNEKGSIFVRCDYNGNWIVRCLLNEILGKDNFLNDLIISRITKKGFGANRYPTANDYLYWYSKTNNYFFKEYRKFLKPNKEKWHSMDSMSGGRGTGEPRIILGELRYPPKNRVWTFSQNRIYELEKKGYIKLNSRGTPIYKVLEQNGEPLDSNWTDIPGYSFLTDFQTENSEILLKRVIESTSEVNNFVMDFFLGSGTTTAVAHKLGRKWIGMEMGEHFYSVVLPRMKKVLFYDPSGISKEVKKQRNNASGTILKEGDETPRQVSPDTPLKEEDVTPLTPLKEGNYEGGGFFKYYELEQYEETLANCKYEDGDLFQVPGRSPYEEYVFLKDEKLLKAMEIDYENKKINIDLSKLYPNIDIAETLSNLTGKWIKKITPCQTKPTTTLQEGNSTPLTPLQEGNCQVEFDDGTIIDTTNLDYKLIKPLIWWE